MCKRHILNVFSMLNMAIYVDQLLECTISIKFKFQIQFVMFICGQPWTLIDPHRYYVGTGGKPSTWFPPEDS